MSTPKARPTLSRRTLLAGGGVLGGAALLGGRVRDDGRVTRLQPSAAVTHPRKEVHLAGTDGWVSMPKDAPADPPFFPDSLAPSPFDTYVFGFRDVTGLTAAQMAAQRGHAQISAPMLAFDEEDDIYITLTNLGLLQRPDLFDGHTLHWHGFVNAIPLFDGVPELSLAVPVGRDFTYFYRPHDAGTYMYHCHFEDVEHVQMGMTGMVFVRPKQNRNPVAGHPAGTKYAYNDGDGSTRYDREFAFMITELWSAAHYRDAHIQVNDWTDYAASFWLLNGRGYPDTLAPNGNPTARPRQDGCSTSRSPRCVTCNAGDRVLLRLSNLGYQNHAMIGRQHRPHRGRQGRLPAAGPRRHGQLPDHEQRGRRPGREPRRALHRSRPREVPALRPQLLLPRQRGRPGLRRDDDGDRRQPSRNPRPADRRERLTGPERSHETHHPPVPAQVQPSACWPRRSPSPGWSPARAPPPPPPRGCSARPTPTTPSR